MTATYDVAVVGLGAMGGAAAFHLAKRGLSVLGLDRHRPPHTLGSSHGETRIIRAAYAEGPHYVEIVQRAYELWEELQEETGADLFSPTGGVFVGSSDSEMVQGSELSAKAHNLTYERISGTELASRWPVFQPDEDMIAIYDPKAGVLIPEACVQGHLDLAAQNGADLRFDEGVESWEATESGVTISTNAGTYQAGSLVLAAGAWMPELLKGLDLPLEVERQVLFWFDSVPDAPSFAPSDCPIYVWDVGLGTHFYGFPDFGTGVKVARMHNGEATNPEAVRRDYDQVDELPIREFLSRHMPSANGTLRSGEVCMFTNTPDLDFALGLHPEHSNVAIASPCSGHGFKFASAVGEILADLATEGKTRFDIEPFSVTRFANIK